MLLFSRQVVFECFVTPWTVVCQAPLSMGFPGQEYRTGLPVPSPGDLPHPGIKPMSPELQANYYCWATGKGSIQSSYLFHGPRIITGSKESTDSSAPGIFSRPTWNSDESSWQENKCALSSFSGLQFPIYSRGLKASLSHCRSLTSSLLSCPLLSPSVFLSLKTLTTSLACCLCFPERIFVKSSSSQCHGSTV